MRKKLLYPFGFVLGLLTLVHYSCQKEINPGFLNPAPPPVAENVSASISGRVVAENGLPVEGAVVKAGSASTTTNINGDFTFTNVLLDKNAGFVKVEKQGYFSGMRTFITRENTTNQVEIELIPKTVSGSFDAAAGGTVTIASGGSIQFPANAIINTGTNAAYNGNVSVSAYFLNPEAPNFASIMPGDLRALTTTNEERALQSFGMMAVELTGAGGEKLNLSSGKTAVLTFPIPSSLMAQAAATIPLWFFDESKGLWKEEGVATKQGSNYVGAVSHFSFWNVDVPYPLVNFEATIKQQSGAPLPYTRVVVKMAGDSATTSGSGYTDVSGKVSGKVPANKNLQLVVYSPCGAIVYTQNIGPFSTNANLGTITVGNVSTVNFTGTVVDCNNAPVAKGFVNIYVNGSSYRTSINNGNYTFTTIMCNAGGSADIVAFDSATNKLSSVETVTMNNTTITKSLTACNTTRTEFLDFTLDTTSYSFNKPIDSITVESNSDSLGNRVHIMASNISGTEIRMMDFYFYGQGIGTFNIIDFYLTVGQNRYRLSQNGSVQITEYGPIGGYIAGKITTQVWNTSTGILDYIPLSVNFRIKRYY